MNLPKTKLPEMLLYPGMLIKTNYSGPYRIKRIVRDCRCPSYLDRIGVWLVFLTELKKTIL